MFLSFLQSSHLKVLNHSPMSDASVNFDYKSPSPRNHLSETYQIPTFRQEKKCFIYKPIRVFADNCECQILGRDDKVQRLPGPEGRLVGGGVGGAPGPPHPCSEEGRRQSAAAAHSPFNGDSPFMNSFTTFTNRAPLGKTVPEGINTSPAPPTPTGRCKHPRQDAHTSRGTGSLLDVKPNVLPDCVPRANTTLSLPAS